MDWIHQVLDPWLGLSVEPRHLTAFQISLRAVVVFGAALLMLRLAHKRFFASKNALDILLTFVLASTLARAINGSAPFFSTLWVGFLLVLLHNGITRLACWNHRFGQWVKGHSAVVIQEGHVDQELLKRHHLSVHDLQEDLRSNGSLTDPKLVRLAVLERSGDISVIRTPHVATVAVENGVQTVKIEIEG